MRVVMCLLSGLALAVAPAIAAVPQMINYQGYLTDTQGGPLDTVVAMSFAVYDAATNGTQLWTETQPACSVRDGLFNVLLGSVNRIPDSAFADTNVWLGITIGGDNEMSPRARVVSVAYAYRVGTVDGASGGMITGDVNIEGKGNIGYGNTNTGDWAFVTGVYSNAAGYSASVGGGYVNTASGSFSTVSGGAHNRARGPFAVVAGGGGASLADSNSAMGDYSAIGGGRRNVAGGDYSVVAGGGSSDPGYGNTASGMHATVSGGRRNQATQTETTVGGGYANIASGSQATVGGGWGNTASGSVSTVAGGWNNRVTGTRASIGGGRDNEVSGYAATAAGGFDNDVIGYAAAVGGGRENRARGSYSVVAGGGGASEADSNSALADYSAIGGGSSNQALDVYTTVSGGYDNHASGYAAAVGGGYMNEASAAKTTVGGGQENDATNLYATVGGGFGNDASGYGMTIGGGQSNSAGWGNYGTGQYATIGGGKDNWAEGSYSVVAGGKKNRAFGDYSFVAGGGDSLGVDSNCTYGDYSGVLGGRGNATFANYSLVAGYRAQAWHTGSFVWADCTETFPFSSSAEDQFNIRASGGVRIYTNPWATIGVTLGPGDNTWNQVCDSTTKTDICAVNTGEMLDKIAQLPIKRWRFKDGDPDIEHISPMAQDFWNLFHVGSDSLKIPTLDPAGIAFAAIQELHKANKRLEEENEAMKAELKQLRLLLQNLLVSHGRNGYSQTTFSD